MDRPSHIASPEAGADETRSSTDVWLLAACLAGLYIVIGLVVNSYVLTPDVVHRSWLESGMETQIEELASRQHTFRLFGYALTPLLVVIRIGFSAVCISIGCALMSWDVQFSDLFRVSTQAEIVWVAASVTQLACALFVVDIETMTDYTTFYPLSALNLIELGEDDLWAVYLLKSINVFEVVYAATLTTGLRPFLRKSPARLVSLVGLSYGGGTLLLVSAITFALMVLT